MNAQFHRMSAVPRLLGAEVQPRFCCFWLVALLTGSFRGQRAKAGCAAAGWMRDWKKRRAAAAVAIAAAARGDIRTQATPITMHRSVKCLDPTTSPFEGGVNSSQSSIQRKFSIWAATTETSIYRSCRTRHARRYCKLPQKCAAKTNEWLRGLEQHRHD